MAINSQLSTIEKSKKKKPKTTTTTKTIELKNKLSKQAEQKVVVAFIH